MKRSACLSIALLTLATPTLAVTLPSGEVVVTQAAVNAGNVTPGDAPGFPLTISVPGSYRLASNLTVTSVDVNGIEVRANEVTIDLNGFTLAGSGVGRNGIASFNRTLTVKNGTVRGFTRDGVRTIEAMLAIDNLVVTASGRNGIWADTTGGTKDAAYASVRNSKVVANAATGISCGASCLVQNTIVSRNGANGIYFEKPGGIALGNTAIDNAFNAIYFAQPGGAGNNVAMGSQNGQLSGPYIPMQPNACEPDGCGPAPP